MPSTSTVCVRSGKLARLETRRRRLPSCRAGHWQVEVTRQKQPGRRRGALLVTLIQRGAACREPPFRNLANRNSSVGLISLGCSIEPRGRTLRPSILYWLRSKPISRGVLVLLIHFTRATVAQGSNSIIKAYVLTSFIIVTVHHVMTLYM